MRIISLVPSITELVVDLGLANQLVACTKFCVHPKSVTHSLPKIGGTKNLHMARITALNPDLIIANKEENERQQVETLQKNHRVLLTDVSDFNTAMGMIQEVGKATQTMPQALQLVSEIELGFKSLQSTNKTSAIYLMWNKPYMAAAGDTFISAMMEMAGFRNMLYDKTRYPIIHIEELQKLKPRYLLLSSEPYPFKEVHQRLLSSLMPQTNVLLVDGEVFSWYGSRMKLAANYFKELHRQLRF